MKTTYVYPAVIQPEKEGNYSVFFPDITGCCTGGDTLEEAMFMAEDALCLMLYDMEERRCEIPKPSAVNEIQSKIKNGNFVTLVKCDTLKYRKFYKEKSVRKTLTIPGWLNDMAEAADVNFSQELQNALAHKLGVTL